MVKLHEVYTRRTDGPSALGSLPVRAAFGEAKLRGRFVLERDVRANLAYLGGLEGQLGVDGAYALLLSGESHVSDPPLGQMSINSKKVLAGLGWLDKSYLSFGGALSGPDYDRLKSESPTGRYKFYSSLDLTSPQNVERGISWFSEVVERSHAQGLSLTAKSFDHAYDSLNLYTWHPAELASIMKDLYPKYEAAGLYFDTPHFFQGSLEGVSPNHIGYVQEPISGWPLGLGHSHSGRMRVLGGALDAYRVEGTDLSIENFVQAASEAHVDPRQPYLIAA